MIWDRFARWISGADPDVRIPDEPVVPAAAPKKKRRAVPPSKTAGVKKKK